MRIKDYLYTATFAALVVTGFIIGGFAGGYLAGLFSGILMFTTVGKIAFRKTEKRIDAAIRLKRMMDDK